MGLLNLGFLFTAAQFLNYTLSESLETIRFYKLSIIAQGGKMLFSALDLCLFFWAEILALDTSFGFYNEVKFIEAIILNDDGPVRVVAAKRSGNLEPVRQFGKDFDIVVCIQALRKFPFNVRVINGIFINSRYYLSIVK